MKILFAFKIRYFQPVKTTAGNARRAFVSGWGFILPVHFGKVFRLTQAEEGSLSTVNIG